nr:hypothetical protein CFP56_11000 [Quercus suber]
MSAPVDAKARNSLEQHRAGTPVCTTMGNIATCYNHPSELVSDLLYASYTWISSIYLSFVCLACSRGAERGPFPDADGPVSGEESSRSGRQLQPSTIRAFPVTQLVLRRCNMSLWSSYRALTPRTRMLLGGGIIAWSAIGLFISDRAEEAWGLTPTEQDKQKLREVLPRISVRDREP